MNYVLTFPLFPCLPLALRSYLVLWGGMLSALPAGLCAWPVFSHWQYLLYSNSKHGIYLGSPFLPVPRETHSKWNTSAPPVLATPHSGENREPAVAPLSSLTAEVFRPIVLSFARDNLGFLLRAKCEDQPKESGAKEAGQSPAGGPAPG